MIFFFPLSFVFSVIRQRQEREKKTHRGWKQFFKGPMDKIRSLVYQLGLRWSDVTPLIIIIKKKRKEKEALVNSRELCIYLPLCLQPPPKTRVCFEARCYTDALLDLCSQREEPGGVHWLRRDTGEVTAPFVTSQGADFPKTVYSSAYICRVRRSRRKKITDGLFLICEEFTDKETHF